MQYLLTTTRTSKEEKLKLALSENSLNANQAGELTLNPLSDL